MFRAVVAVLILFQQVVASDKHLFNDWKQRHRKAYSDVRTELSAFHAWMENKAVVDAVNADPTSSWKAGLNQFSDMTPEEFRKKILLPTLSSSSNSTIASRRVKHTKKASVHTPESFDWRSDGAVAAVTPVRDQGSVGSCWAFSTVENIEGQWALAGHSLTELSAEFLVDCDGTTDGTHADCSVFGGWPYLAYQFVVAQGGIPSEETWPYCAGTGDCYPCMQGPVKLCGPPPYYCDEERNTMCKSVTSSQFTAKISDWQTMTDDESELTSALVEQGPLSVLLDASGLQYYQSGVWDGHLPSVSPLMGCHPDSLDHAVLLVGYGSDAGADFWSVKNSWGENWGEKGYFRISRGKGMCGINTAVTSAVV